MLSYPIKMVCGCCDEGVRIADWYCQGHRRLSAKQTTPLRRPQDVNLEKKNPQAVRSFLCGRAHHLAAVFLIPSVSPILLVDALIDEMEVKKWSCSQEPASACG